MRSSGKAGLRAFVFAGLGLAPTIAWASPPTEDGSAADQETVDAEPAGEALSAQATAESPAETPAEPTVDSTPNDTAQYPIRRTFTDLGTIRYVDPAHQRELWLGLDLGGSYVPESLGLFERTLWTVRLEPAYALGLTDWLTFGGRHGLIWYDAENIRARYHHHELEISGRPTAAGRRSHDFTDRLAFGFEHHNLRLAVIDGDDFKLGGVLDYVIRLGYGMRHHVTGSFDIDWNAQGRYVWLFEDTQRQLRGSIRFSGIPGRKRGHRIGFELIGFVIHRDERQFGNKLERTSVEGQAAFTYEWVGRKNLGLFSKLRVTSALFSGEAPVYEVREEALNDVYAEASLGFRWAWR